MTMTTSSGSTRSLVSVLIVSVTVVAALVAVSFLGTAESEDSAPVSLATKTMLAYDRAANGPRVVKMNSKALKAKWRKLHPLPARMNSGHTAAMSHKDHKKLVAKKVVLEKDFLKPDLHHKGKLTSAQKEALLKKLQRIRDSIANDFKANTHIAHKVDCSYPYPAAHCRNGGVTHASPPNAAQRIGLVFSQHAPLSDEHP